jgi:glucose-1-phosphate cytidylyltransferase
LIKKLKRFNYRDIKVVILCGGRGQRISVETKYKPKPLIKIGSKPILQHIMEVYKKNGFNNFYLLLGYKGQQIKDYFRKKKFFNIKFIDSGISTGTAGRLLFIRKFLKKNENFLLTYGDGLTNQNLMKLLKLHLKKNKICTMTIVRPPTRFGEVKIKNDFIIDYKEKRKVGSGWINGGFMALNEKIYKYIGKNQAGMFESKPMEKLSKKKKLIAFKHNGFWQCMDTLKEKEYLNFLLRSNKAPWIN